MYNGDIRTPSVYFLQAMIRWVKCQACSMVSGLYLDSLLWEFTDHYMILRSTKKVPCRTRLFPLYGTREFLFHAAEYVLPLSYHVRT